MTCALTEEQLENLYRVVYTEMALARNGKVPFDVHAFTTDLYKQILEKTNDHNRAVAFVQQVPEFILSAMSMNNLWKHLLDTGFDANAIMKLASDFKDENTGYQAVTDYVSVKLDSKQAEQAVIVHQDTLHDVQPIVEEVPEEDSAKPSNPWTTTSQESKFWDPNTQPDEYAARNQIDEEKTIHNNVIRSIGQAVREAEGDSSKARVGTHVGFKLQLVPASEYPHELLHKETQIWLNGPKGNLEKHNQGVLAVISDNSGNWLYFDEKGELADKTSGKPVYSFIRVPKLKDGKLTFLKRNNQEQLLTPEEMLKKEQKLAEKEGMPFSEEFSKKRLEELTKDRKEKVDFIQKARDFVTKDKTKKVLLDITGGTLGVITSKWEKIGQFITNEDLSTLSLDKSQSGSGGGRYVISLKNVATPIPIDRPQITTELASKIATILSMPVKIDGELMSNSTKADYVKQFIHNNNKASNYFSVKYNPEDGTILVSISGVSMTVPAPEKIAEIEKDKLQKVYNVVYNNLLNVAGKKSQRNPMGMYPARLSLNDAHAKTGEYVDYNFDGDNATREVKSYYEFIRNGAQIGVAGTDTMEVTQLNAYLHFAPSQEVIDEVNGKTEEPAKETEKSEAPDPHSDDINANLLDGLLKARGIDNTATAADIASAKNWYESHPISKHIPFKAMFNIVNSDAYAQWNTNGITLFQGSNFTDLYHEAWHGFTQLFLTKKEKSALYAEARKLPGSFKNLSGASIPFALATEFQLEEYLAEDFRKYSISEARKSSPNPVRNTIFRKIWNFLKELFSGVKIKDIITQPDSVANIRDIYNKLFYGQLNSYLPSIDNVQFGVLNSGVEPVTEKDQQGPMEKSLSLEESRLLVDSIDSLISETINRINTIKGNATATTETLTEKDKLSKLYSNIKKNFEARRDAFYAQAAEEKDEFLKEQKLENARLLDYAIRNFGDPSKVLAQREDRGLVAYHQKKTTFLGVSRQVYDVIDEASSNEDVINKGMQRNDRAGNEISLKELATDETLYLIKSLHRIQDGHEVNNRLGIPELVDFDKMWNKIVRTLEGSMTPEEMYNKLIAAQGIFPEFSQLVKKLADPTLNMKDSTAAPLTAAEFNMNTKFWQDFNKPRVHLIQMTLDKSNYEDGEGNNLTSYDMHIGQASAEHFKIVQTWKNKFRTASPAHNKFILQDAQRHNYLNAAAVMKEFSDPRGLLKEGREYDFLRAVGLYFDEDNVMMKDLLKKQKGVYGVGFIFNAIRAVDNALRVPAKPTKEELAAQTAAHAFILDPIGGLSSSQPDLGFDNNAGRLKALAEFYAKYSDEYSDFSVVNAENNKQYEHTLNNTLTITLNSINKAKTYQELVNPNVDTQGNFAHMRWLDIDRNPLAKASVWLNSIFDLDRFNKDGSENLNFGKKRTSSTEKGSGPIQVNIENLSGVQITINGLFPETGIATARSDRSTKFLSDFHMLLLTGRMELMRHASKSSAYDVVMDTVRTDPSKKDATLYVDTDKFISPRGTDTYDGFGYAYQILQNYVGAELSRIRTVNDNLSYYKNIAGYNRSVGNNKISGQVFAAFDDCFTDATKQKLYDLKGDFTQEISKAENTELRNQVKAELKNYFDRLTAQNESIFNETKYMHQRLYDKIRAGAKGLSNEQIQKAAIRSFTYNSWIHNFESLSIIYGDLAQYNHAKEEFHKRNAGVGSTGHIFRTDKAAQNYITNQVGRKYAESIGAPSKAYDGRLDTSVIADSVINSVYEKEYREAFMQYYDNIFSNRKDLSSAQKTELVQQKVDAAMDAYSNMKEGDGQGLIQFDTYRILRKLEGKWDENFHEKLYNDIVSGKDVATDDVHKFFPAYKIQYYGPLDTEGLPIMSFHKFSLYPMIPSVIKGTNMETVHNMITKQGVDYILFESGSKLGGITSNGKPDKLYSDNDKRTVNTGLTFTKNTIFANYLKDQLDIHDEFKGKVIFSTQFRAIVTEGIYSEGVPVDYKGTREEWEALSDDQKKAESPLHNLASGYLDRIQELTELKKQELLEEAGWVEDAEGNTTGDLKNLLEIVRKNLSLQDIADHQLDFLDTDTEGNIKWDLSMHLNAEKLEKLLTAMVNNRLIRQKVKGESLVQVASSFFEKPGTFTNPTEEDLKKYRGTNDLPTYHKLDKSDPQSKTSAMKVKIALQGDWLNLLKLKHNDGEVINTRARLNEMIKNEEWLNKEQNRKAVTMVGVRIPVQGLNSMEFMEIYDFLPAEAGNIIIPPSEIVAKSGADFDIDKLTVFMTAIGSNGDFLTRDKYTKGTEAIEQDIQALRDKHQPLKDEALKILKEAKEKRNLSKEFMKKELPKIQEALGLLKEERSHLLDLVRNVIAQLKDVDRMPRALVDASDKPDSDLLKTLWSVHTGGGLKRVDKRLDEYYSDIRKLKTEKMQELYDEKELQMQSLKDYTDQVQAARNKANEVIEPFRKKLGQLRELKKRYSSTVENEIIADIRQILEHPSNYISLIRPNGTDIARPVADELAPYVQEYNPQENYSQPNTKKGVSPTRVLETSYNLYKHESNNIGKVALGIGAKSNKYHALFKTIGLHTNSEYTHRNGQKRQVRLLLEHNKIQLPDGKEGISMSNVYDATGENKIADVISQLMNGWVDVEKDAWVFFVQGNAEVSPLLLSLIEQGVPYRTAGWFVSQPLVRKYVKNQRLVKGTFAGPMNVALENPNFFRSAAANMIFEEVLGRKVNQKKQYEESLELSKKVLGDKKFFTQDQIESVVKKNDMKSDLAMAMFLHYLEFEQMNKGLGNLRFKTDVDTKRSTTLYAALEKMIAIESLKKESVFPEAFVEKLFDKTILGNFLVQKLQTNLWGKLFKLRNHEAVNNFLASKLENDTKNIEEAFGDDSEKFVAEFKNDLVQFIFQNTLRDFNLGKDKNYKGYSVEDKVPIKYVDKLSFGAFVKKDEAGETKIYIDDLQLKKDWMNKSFTATATAENSYKDRGLATVPAKAFMWRGSASEKEFYRFVVEREYLRNIIPFSKFEKTKEFKENYLRNFSILQQSKTAEESQEDFATRVGRSTYEQMLRNKALENTFNPWKLFQSETSVPMQFLQIVQQYPQLEKEYGFVSQLAVTTDQKLDISNLTLKDKDLSADKVNRYYENIKKLSDPSVRKVADPEENMRVSMFFSKLSLFAFMQSGLSKNPNSFTQVVPYESFIRVMEEPVNDFVKNVLDKADHNNVLNNFFYDFLRQNSRGNRRMRGKFKNYLMNYTPPELRVDYDPEAPVKHTTADLTETHAEGVYTYNSTSKVQTATKEGLTSKLVPKKAAEYRKILQANPQVVFVFNDNKLAQSRPELRTNGALDMRSMGNSLGVVTSPKANTAFREISPEEITSMKNEIDNNLMSLAELKAEGHDIAFPAEGLGNQALMPKELFLHLSEQLYKLFGYLNPGSISLPTVRELVGKEQGVTDQEVEDFIRQCINIPS